MKTSKEKETRHKNKQAKSR